MKTITKIKILYLDIKYFLIDVFRKTWFVCIIKPQLYYRKLRALKSDDEFNKYLSLDSYAMQYTNEKQLKHYLSDIGFQRQVVHIKDLEKEYGDSDENT